MKKSIGKKLIIIIAIVCFLAGLSVGGFALYNNHKSQAEIQAVCNGIAEDYKSFENAQSRDEKLGILSDMIEESNKHTGSEKVKAEYEEHIELMRSFFTEDYNSRLEKVTSATLDEIPTEGRKTLISDLEELKTDIEKEADITLDDENKKKDYIALIDSNTENIRQSFKSEYNKVLEDNTVENVETVENKELLEGYINNLKDFKDKLEEEFSQEYTPKADELIESYEDRIKGIEKGEAEAKKQEELQQEYYQEDDADTDYIDDYSGDSGADDNNDNYNNNSSVGINPNNSDCVGEGHGGLHHSYTSIDENGNPTGTSYFYNDGCAYDTEGNSWNYKDLW